MFSWPGKSLLNRNLESMSNLRVRPPRSLKLIARKRSASPCGIEPSARRTTPPRPRSARSRTRSDVCAKPSATIAPRSRPHTSRPRRRFAHAWPGRSARTWSPFSPSGRPTPVARARGRWRLSSLPSNVCGTSSLRTACRLSSSRGRSLTPPSARPALRGLPRSQRSLICLVAYRRLGRRFEPAQFDSPGRAQLRGRIEAHTRSGSGRPDPELAAIYSSEPAANNSAALASEHLAQRARAPQPLPDAEGARERFDATQRRNEHWLRVERTRQASEAAFLASQDERVFVGR